MGLLEVEGLTAGYGGLNVLRDLDFSVADGSITVLLGANGSGKSTTLRALSGLITRAGEVRLGGRSIVSCRPEEIVRSGVAHVPEGRGVFGALSVRENLRIGAYLRRDRAIDLDIDKWFDVFPNLAARSKEMAASLSGGEQQMLAIARALMSRPRLVLLDEPSLGLAPVVVRDVFELLAETNRVGGTAMLIVEQNANIALSIADSGLVLARGQIVRRGDGMTLRQDDAIRLAYLGK